MKGNNWGAEKQGATYELLSGLSRLGAGTTCGRANALPLKSQNWVGGAQSSDIGDPRYSLVCHNHPTQLHHERPQPLTWKGCLLPGSADSFCTPCTLLTLVPVLLWPSLSLKSGGLHNLTVKSPDSRTSLPMLKSCLSHLLAVSPWAGYLTSLCLSFLIWETNRSSDLTELLIRAKLVHLEHCVAQRQG